jgi:hypothetical protein
MAFKGADVRKGKYEFFIDVLEYQEYLGLTANEVSALYKNKRIARVYVENRNCLFLDAREFVKMLGSLTEKGNKQALVLLLILSNETIERRTNAEIGYVEREQEIEARALTHFINDFDQ